MALIRCPNCAREAPDVTPACIHCGWQLSPSKTGDAAESATERWRLTDPATPPSTDETAAPTWQAFSAPVSSVPVHRRTFPGVLAIALVVVGAAVAAFVLLHPSSASAVSLTTARFVPADAGLYVALNTDLSSTQWVQAFNLATRLGRKDPQQDLRDAAQQQGNVDWQSEVAPFLGGDIAVYLRGFDASGAGPQGAVVARCADAGRALAVIESKLGADLQRASYHSVPYEHDAGGSIYLARLSDHIVVASDQQSLFAVLDTYAGRKPALSSVADFKSLRSKLMQSYLLFAYADSRRFLEAAAQSGVTVQSPVDLQQLDQALNNASSSGLTGKPAALTLGTQKNSIEIEGAVAGTEASSLPLLQPRDSHFVALAPAETAIFASIGGLADTFDQILQQNRTQIDQALRQSGFDGGLDDALRQAGAQLGLNSLQDAIDLFDGEIAVAVNYPSQQGAGPEGVVLADVRDSGKARDLLQSVVSATGLNAARTETIGSATVTVLSGPDAGDLAYTVTDGYLAAGTESSLRAFLTRQGPSLADSDTYKQTVAEAGSSLGSFGYLDLAALVKQGSTGSDQLDAAAAHLRGGIINLVTEHGVSRLSVSLTTAQ